MNNLGTILIADDEKDIREILKDHLEEEGFNCYAVANAQEAINVYKDKKDEIELVMSDIKMPGKSGLILLDEIKEISPDAIIVIVSALKDVDSAISALSKGAYDYLSKPFKLNEVSLVVQKGIEKNRLITENKNYQKELENKVKERTQELQEALRQLDNTYLFTLRALVTALDTRDAETQGHSIRVTKYTIALTKLIGIEDEREIKNIEYGALLHDIGKIGISDTILRKPSPLTKEEWEIMKTHPSIGYKILKDINFLGEASDIVLYHHERYDGTGYPHGLKGEEIPLSARIFAVADTIDSMTSDRVYRKALTWEVTAKELKELSGIQFDPIVIEAFFSVDITFWKGIQLL